MTFKNYSNSWNDKTDILIEKTEDEPIVKTQTGIVFNCEKVYLRKSDSQDSEPVDILDRGTELFVESVDGHWCKVTTLDDKSGYIMKKFVKIN